MAPPYDDRRTPPGRRFVAREEPAEDTIPTEVERELASYTMPGVAPPPVHQPPRPRYAGDAMAYETRERALERLIAALEAAPNQAAQAAAAVAALQAELLRLSVQFVETQKRLERIESDAETAESHKVQDLREQLKESRDAQKHWLRYVVGVIVGMLVSLIVGFVLASARK